MLELLLGPANLFLKRGIESFSKSKDFKNLKAAMHDRVRRECKYNRAILDELKKDDDEDQTLPQEAKIALINSIKTEAFDDINSGVIPLCVFFPDEIDKGKWPAWGNKTEKYMVYTSSIKSQSDIVERLYHRIAIAKTFAKCSMLRGDMDYLRFLIAILENTLKTYC